MKKNIFGTCRMKKRKKIRYVEERKKERKKERKHKKDVTKSRKIGWQHCMIISRQLKTLKKQQQ